MSSVFGIPICATNLSLPMQYSPNGASNQLGIPKLIINTNSGIPEHFSKLFSSGVSEFRTPEEFISTPYLPISNSPEDLLDFTKESYLRCVDLWIDSEEDIILQKRLSSFIRPGSYSYGTGSLFGRYFMRKYSYLIL